MMDERPLLGDEAVALGAIHSGLSGAYSYPGTPATEIFEFVEAETRGGPRASEGGVHCAWSANEKVAYEEALGMSYAGRRALVSFKHVGLNVAADPFMSSALSGVGGGFVVATADDPGMHSSQNEQDSRIYADFAQIPCLEPADGQQAYDMTREAFDLSERFDVPVMVRLVTRLAHSRNPVRPRPPRPKNPLRPSSDSKAWILLPVNARVRFAKLTEKQPELLAWSESSPFNALALNPRGSRVGTVVCGIAANYLAESFAPLDAPPSSLRIGAYPIPTRLVARLVESVDEVVVFEDGYPYVERALRGLLGPPGGTRVHGRLDGTLPRTGELTPDTVRAALGLPERPRQTPVGLALAGRPPALCQGCPHADTFAAIRAVLDDHPSGRVFTDIGCYTLGALAPHNAGDACTDMGASVSMAMGAAQAGLHPVISTIGDSTFVHSGMTPLVGAVRQDLNMTLVILDNAITAMTGMQESMAIGEALVTLVRGLGVHPDHLLVIDPHRKNHDANVALLRREVDHRGLSVIVARRPCIQMKKA